MDESNEKKQPWPKYLPYTPVAMGMIQPEWMFMSHFFDDDDAEAPLADPALPPKPASPPTLPPAPSIRIHIRPRKPR